MMPRAVIYGGAVGDLFFSIHIKDPAIIIGQEEGVVFVALKSVGDWRPIVDDVRGSHPEGTGDSMERWKHSIQYDIPIDARHFKIQVKA